MAFAGNFTEKAFKKTIKLIRVTDKELKIFTVNSENFADFTLEAGDIFEIDSVSNTFENRVKIKGAIYRPGDFAIDNKNLKTVKGLIEAAGGITKDAFTNRATIYREGQNKEPRNYCF